MDIFKELIKQISPFLKQMKFVKKRNTFYLKSDKNFGIINFQKSRESTNDLVRLTINFGIYSDILGEMDNVFDGSHPDVEDCHWSARVGAFMPGMPDYWREIGVSDDLTNVTLDVIASIQNLILPEINKRLSDEDLINNWINRDFTGTTEIGRFKYLTTLIKKKGDLETLNQVVEDFMQQSVGKPNASIAMEHLKEIDYNKS
ncbi:DUF4304 domain-containing protein [Pedobacter sp. ISL-68]|uniref:DUF4304 domain-containing protein n=1 Tax=unclassified Pedobacter TaxID=2628915 RepID=UPI001BE6CAE3|nr:MULTISPECIES: DUF4304 domain-containing protein [unclassified Pedobacter]MBT2559830.1 DUF4304 domain-containing protein [Pedobacter sp. ISL-64]MBT2592135.1 DUF4304 domain-containing protein [Pedobacter sp. ISL-68]